MAASDSIFNKKASTNSLDEARENVFHNTSDHIFTWLPVQSIYKFRSVSKDLMNLPLNKQFRKQHVENMKKQLIDDLPSTFILQKTDSYKGSFPAISLYKEVGIPRESLNLLCFNTTQVLASSCGLLFCFHKANYKLNREESFLIFNPITQQKKFIPPPPIYSSFDFKKFTTYKVIFDCSKSTDDDDFLLMMITSIETNVHDDDLHVDDDDDESPLLYDTMIYSRSSASDSESNGGWKQMRKEEHYHANVFRVNKSVYIDGVIYCINKLENDIIILPRLVAYDLMKGTSKMLVMYDGARRTEEIDTLDLYVFLWGKSSVGLVKVLLGWVNLWVLEDMDTNSWKHIFRIREQDVGVDRVPTFMVWGVRFVDKNKVLIVIYGKIYECCFGDDGSFGKIELIQEFYFHAREEFTFFPFTSSLRDV